MKWPLYILLFISSLSAGQNTIEGWLVKETPLDAQTFTSIDNFNNLYFINHETFYKKTPNTLLNYANVQMGNITSSNTFNPLKINLFYSSFNTVVILDNRLASIFKIDFNTLEPYREVSHVSTGYDNTLWIFNQTTQQLELFDYKTKQTKVATMPIQSEVLALASNYNYCWLLTKNNLYTYNYRGSLISKTPNNGYTALAISNQEVVLKSNSQLYYLKNNALIKVQLPEMLIKQFYVTNQTLYIYDGKLLREFQLKTE